MDYFEKNVVGNAFFSQVDEFGKTAFDRWKDEVETSFKKKKLYEYLYPDDTYVEDCLDFEEFWKQGDFMIMPEVPVSTERFLLNMQVAFSTLRNMFPPELQSHSKEYRPVHEIWAAFQKKALENKELKARRLYEKLLSLKLLNPSNIHAHIVKFRSLLSELGLCDGEPKELHSVVIFQTSLPPFFDDWINSEAAQLSKLDELLCSSQSYYDQNKAKHSPQPNSPPSKSTPSSSPSSSSSSSTVTPATPAAPAATTNFAVHTPNKSPKTPQSNQGKGKQVFQPKVTAKTNPSTPHSPIQNSTTNSVNGSTTTTNCNSSFAFSIFEKKTTSLIKQLQPTEQHRLKRIESIERLNRICGSIKKLEGATCTPFGSFTSNLYFPKSDLDISLLFPYEEKFAKKYDTNFQKNALHNLRRALPRDGYVDIEFISSARIPILMFFDLKTKLSCDVSVNNYGFFNSKVFKMISEMDNRCKILGKELENK